MFSIDDYSYQLPLELIAQQPAARRDQSNLLHLNRQSGVVSHHRFDEIGKFLQPGDVLVINDTAVIPARLEGRKATGGRVEVLISDYRGGLKAVAEQGAFICRCLVKASKPPAPGARLYFRDNLTAEVLGAVNGAYTLKFSAGRDIDSILDRAGNMPLPPYIKRASGDSQPCNDRSSYQTVYARHKGAIAAPTAGLHFTAPLLDRLRANGIKIAALTLHVGPGTFLPVRVEDIRRHSMHSEPYSLSEETADIINAARARGCSVVAVGTTCVRTLEHSADAGGRVAAGSGPCKLFIYPGYRFKVVDMMITNFHLPRSTLLMLVSAFAGRSRVLKAYCQAVKLRYRFYSYGDAMLIA